MSKKNKAHTSQANKSMNDINSPKKSVDNKRKNVNLNNIIEVTQENYTHRFNDQNQQSQSLTTGQNTNRSFWRRSLQCLQKIFKGVKPVKQISMVVKEQQLLKTIERLRSQKIVQKPYLPPLQDQKKKTLAIDLDGTLLYSTFTEPQFYDFKCQLPFKNSKVNIYTQLRFGVQSFLFEMSKNYQIVLYTIRKQLYTTKMLQALDKKHWISHVLYKDKCITLNKVHHLKSLKVLGRNPNDVVFLDHDPVSGILQPQNFCQIKCFTGQKNDRQLLKILPFLKQISNKKSVIPVYKHFQEFKNREIQLQFLNLESASTQAQQQSINQHRQSLKLIEQMNKQNCIQMKKKKYGHKKTNSEVESLAKKIEQQEDGQNSNEHEQSGCQLRGRDMNKM